MENAYHTKGVWVTADSLGIVVGGGIGYNPETGYWGSVSDECAEVCGATVAMILPCRGLNVYLDVSE